MATRHRPGTFSATGEKTTAILTESTANLALPFPESSHIPMLKEFLAEMARDLGEDCIYFRAGEFATLIYPSGTSELYTGTLAGRSFARDVPNVSLKNRLRWGFRRTLPAFFTFKAVGPRPGG